MRSQRYHTPVRMIAVLLVFTLIIPTGASASVQPRASAYLDNYNAYVYLPGDGEVHVYFNVQGTTTLDELGALSIAIYESTDCINWT